MRRWLKKAGRPMGIFTLVIAGTGILQYFILARQLGEMQSSNADTRNLAQAAKDQASVTRQYLIGTQAAILEFGANLDVAGLFVGLDNSGNVIATKVHAEWQLARARSPESATEWHSFTADTEQIAPKGAFQRLYTLSFVTPQELDVIRENTERETIVLRAKWSYDNGFGERIYKTSCKAWLAFPWVKNKIGGIFRASGWNECSGYTSTIENLRKAERAEPPK
jgi:hypothetical protein